jgi:single-stranded-DNA-specific exonuclease
VPPRPIWIDPEPLPSSAPTLDTHPIVNALLWRRGLRTPEEARAFLSTSPSAAPDPLLLPNIDAAAARVTTALATGERIGIFGDYDVDGITSTALLLTAFHAALRSDDQVIARLPRREEGYGLSLAALDEFAAAGTTLLITVDCGSTDHEHVAAARARGMDVVIIDHHTLNGPIPDGAIVVSAKIDPNGPYQECSAAALAYLFVSVLAQRGVPIDGGEGRPETDLLDFAALGTIGDVAPLTGANRAFVRDGLQVLQRRSRWGIKALCAAAGISAGELNSESIPFRLTPRLNAAGRLGDPRIALDLLLARDPLTAHGLARQIETLNTERRAIGDQIAREAELTLTADPAWESQRCFVLHGESWHPGVLGIVAGKFATRYGRPVVILSGDGDHGKGSARSVPGFDIVAALSPHRASMTHFGGHSQAAGLTIERERIDHLRGWIEAAIEEAGMAIPCDPAIAVAADLAPDQVTMETYHAIERLQPFGTGNDRPILRIENVLVQDQMIMGQDRSHLRLTLGTKRGPVKAVFWSAADRAREARIGTMIDVVGVLKRDTWNGNDRIQLELKDFRQRR